MFARPGHARKLSRTRKSLAVVRSAAALLQGTTKDAMEETANVASPLKAQKIGARNVLGFTSSAPRNTASTPTLPSPRPKSQQSGKRRAPPKERVICEKEKALIEAYRAAAQLLGAAEGDLTLTPIDRNAYKPETSLEEQAMLMEKALIDKVASLEHQIKAVELAAKQAEDRRTKRIADLDRAIFNTKCGVELLSELAAEARREACKRAVEFMKRRLALRTPSLVRIIDDELFVNQFTSKLKMADALLDHHGRKGFLSRMDIDPQRTHVPAGGIF